MTADLPAFVRAPWPVRDPTARMETALAAEAEGQAQKFVLFWGHRAAQPERPGAACLSQWWPTPFTIDGIVYASAEHWMMAGKARVFGDEEALAEVLQAPSPGAAKAIGARVRGFEEQRWARARYELVIVGNHAKFSQHPHLSEYLANTGSKVLVEASPVDRIWGIGWAANDPRATQPSAWRGANLLGFALMEVREHLHR